MTTSSDPTPVTAGTSASPARPGAPPLAAGEVANPAAAAHVSAIERAAAAMWERSTGTSWREADPHERYHTMSEALVAIQALREPSEAMIAAEPPPGGHLGRRERRTRYWTAMVDAIITEGAVALAACENRATDEAPAASASGAGRADATMAPGSTGAGSNEQSGGGGDHG